MEDCGGVTMLSGAGEYLGWVQNELEEATPLLSIALSPIDGRSSSYIILFSNCHISIPLNVYTRLPVPKDWQSKILTRSHYLVPHARTLVNS
jgi:hypothetical protein